MFGNNEYNALNKMLDEAIRGEFTEEHFDERELSKLQTRFKRYLVSSSMSEQRLSEEKNKLKELITDISHQTKTPLTSIVMYSELLNEAASDETVREYANEICVHSRRLEELIHALVKLSRLEAGMLRFEKAPVSLAEIVKKVMEQAYPKAMSKDIAIVFRESMDNKIMADEKWVIEAVCNVLDNGIKYSGDHTRITIELFCYEMFCGIRITDQGIGIAEDEIPKIFSRFYRGVHAREQEGIGVGLYLARSIVEGHGGYIKVKSQEGRGSAMDICFPNMSALKD